MCFPSMAFVMVLILILQQKNDSLDLPFYFTLSFFCCFRNANSLLGKRSTAGCFCLINPKKARIFGVFPKRKHCTIVSFVQCGYGCGSQIWTDDLRVMSSSNASEKSHATQSFSDFIYRFCRRDDDADVDLSSAMTKWGTHFPLFLEKCFYKHGKYFWMNSFCYLITASEKSDVSLHNAFKICPINPPHSKKPQIQLLFPQEHDIITITRIPVKLQKQAEVRTWNPFCSLICIEISILMLWNSSKVFWNVPL